LLSIAQRHNAVGRLQAGATQAAVARDFNVSRMTISRLWRRLAVTGSVADRPRAGRARVTTPAQDRYIRLQHLRNRFQTATATASNVPGVRRISDQTIRNRLRQHGIRARRPVRRVILTPRHCRERFNWCTRYRVRPAQWWRTVLFSDESRFLLRRADGRARVYRRRNERFAPNCVRQVDRFGGGSVMVWAGITHNFRTELVHIPGNLNAVHYRDDILQRHVLPFLNQHNGVFQQDNARPHIARVCRNFLNGSFTN